MPIQVCVHVVHTANFVHVNYLCLHACMQIVYTTVYAIMYFSYIFSQCCIILPYTRLKYVILFNIINNENLNRFSTLTTGKVSGLTICLETVKFRQRNNLRTRFFVYVKGLQRALYVHGHQHARNFSSPESTMQTLSKNEKQFEELFNTNLTQTQIYCNLSKYSFTNRQYDLLNKNLKFCDTCGQYNKTLY